MTEVFELRQYTLHPGKRDTLIELFEREFIEPQEAAGMHVIAQFRDLDDPDRFVWIRSFPDMAAKAFPFFPGRWLVRNKLDNLAKIGSVRAPVFIAHGTDDTLVSPHHSTDLAARLRAAGVPTTLVLVKHTGHTVATPGQQPGNSQLVERPPRRRHAGARSLAT